MGNVALAGLEGAVAAVKDLGLFQGILVVVVVAGVVTLHKTLNGISKILDTILRHKRETERIRAKIANDKKKLAVALKAKKTKVPTIERQKRK